MESPEVMCWRGGNLKEKLILSVQNWNPASDCYVELFTVTCYKAKTSI